MCVHAGISVYMRVYTCISRICVCMRVYLCICMYMHVYARICTYECVCVCAPGWDPFGRSFETEKARLPREKVGLNVTLANAASRVEYTLNAPQRLKDDVFETARSRRQAVEDRIEALRRRKPVPSYLIMILSLRVSPLSWSR